MNYDRPPDTVRAYLDALARALTGAPPALIQDALSDAEEHLRNEIAQNPQKTEAQVLTSAIDTYGTPEEVAETYRTMEASISGPFPRSDEPRERRYGFFNVVSDPKTYGALLYMLLSLFTGIFYFTWVVTGLALSVGLFILIIGIPFALLFIGSVRVLAHAEGRIVEALLGVRMPRRLPPEFPEYQTGLMARIGAALRDPRTWSSMLYLVLKLPLGILYFVIAVVGLAVPLGLIGGALLGLITGHSHIELDAAPVLEHILGTAPGLALVALAGLLLFFVMLHLARAIGWVHGRLAEGLLVRL